MKKILGLLIAIIFVSSAIAQPWKNSLKLDVSTKKIDDQTALITINASITKDWHIFSKFHDPNKSDFIGMPTVVKFKGKGFKAIGNYTETPKAKAVHDEFGVSLELLNNATFTQKVRLTDKNASGTVSIEGQVCNDIQGCIPFEKEFDFKLAGYLANVETTPTALQPKNDKTIEAEEQQDLGATNVETQKIDSTKQLKSSDHNVQKIEKEANVSAKKASLGNERSLMLTFLMGLAWGLLALLTPCVFPMIPMTVSFFTKQSGSRKKGIFNALIYGLSIIVIYVLIGLLITVFFGSTGLNDLSTNVWMNLAFFAVFVIFAFSFLGAFEIQLPSKWVNNADKKADKGGLIGIFFMAFTLALVSFSCTGPIIGTLIVESSQTGLLGPSIGMLGFAVALAFPFTLFAIFPSWLSGLPQSGGWLNSIKVILGLLELALALKFLSGVDLAYHWDFLTRELFVAAWVAISAVATLYLFGFIKFAHDSEVKSLTVTRFMFGLVFLIFTVYLIPGMFGAPLQLIDGVAPPRSHSEDHFKFVQGYDKAGGETISMGDSLSKYTSQMFEVDGGIRVFHDLDLGKEYAKIVNKPILLDFTGYYCANCRRTESTVWTNQEIRPLLIKDFVIISLYVDDKTALPANEQIYSETLASTMKYKGHKWSELQIKKYGQVSQPLYVVNDFDGNDLTESIGYTPDINQYRDFLMRGLNKFKELHP